MAALSPVLPTSLMSYSYRQENMQCNNNNGSNRFPEPPSPSYFALSPSYSSAPRESRESPVQDSSYQRLPPLRSINVLPPISTFAEPARQSLSPYEHYPASSYFASGPTSPYSPHHVGTPTIPSPISDLQRPVNKKGPWTKAEDELLIYHVAQQQKSNIAQATHWGDVSKLMGESRTAKQCRERYTQNLAPGLNRQPITEMEATFIREWVIKNGTQWAELSRQPEVRGRSDNHLKNWWNGQRKQMEDRDRAMKKANVRRSSHQSLNQRASVSPLHNGQQSLPPLRDGAAIRSSVSPPMAQSRTLPPPQQNASSSQLQRITMANILN